MLPDWLRGLPQNAGWPSTVSTFGLRCEKHPAPVFSNVSETGVFHVPSGPATVVNPTTIQVFLEQIGSPTVSDVELTATAATGIVATDDGGTWPGVTALVLPFP